ncbi:MAG: DMT family transporter [Chloroflexi bacterium]|nr:DMT family transporter [Chloroflexota bacterium]
MHFTASWRSSTRLLALDLTPSDYGKGVLYALAAGMALGTLGPFSNLAYGAGMGTATFAALRATLGAAVLVAFMRVAGHRAMPLSRLGRRDRALLALTAVAQALLSLSIFAAYGAMPVAAVLAVYFCYPLVVAAASIVLGRERLTAWRALGLALALAGLLTVLLGSGRGGVAVSLLGVALAAFAALCQAGYLVISRSGYSRLPSDQASAVILAGAAVLIWIVAIPMDVVPSGLPWLGSSLAWLAVGVAGLIGAAVAKVFVLRAVRRVGGTRASVLMLSEPLAGVALAALLLGQGLTAWQALGGAGVLVGAALAQRPAGGPKTT